MELIITMTTKDFPLFKKMIKEKYPELKGWTAQRIQTIKTTDENEFGLNIIMGKEDKPMKPKKHEEPEEENPEEKTPKKKEPKQKAIEKKMEIPKKQGRPKLNPEEVESKVLEYLEKNAQTKSLPIYTISTSLGISRPYVEKALFKMEKEEKVHAPTKRWGSKQWSFGVSPIKVEPYHKEKFERLYEGATFDMIRDFVENFKGKCFSFLELEQAHIVDEDKLDDIFNDLQNNRTLLVKKLEVELSVTLKPTSVGSTKLVEVSAQ